MKFEKREGSSKLFAVAENLNEEAFLTTIKNKGVKPGDEKYVIRAFREWDRKPHDPQTVIDEAQRRMALEIKEALEGGPRTPAEARHREEQAHQTQMRLQYGATIADANELHQKLFHGPLLFKTVNGLVFATAGDGKTYTWPAGDNPKKARAMVAEKFMNAHK